MHFFSSKAEGGVSSRLNSAETISLAQNTTRTRFLLNFSQSVSNELMPVELDCDKSLVGELNYSGG